MKLPRPQHSLSRYLALYDEQHTQLGTKLTHMVGIPMIVASVPAAFVSPVAGGALFVGGWALQYVGHYFFEGNSPAFHSDPYFVLVGPVWVTAEWLRLLRLPVPQILRASSDAADEGTNHASPAPVTA